LGGLQASCFYQNKEMVKGENGTMGRELHRREARKAALAETLGNGGVPQAPKSAPGAAGGPSGDKTNTRNLFLSKMRNEGGKAAADAGGARGAGATLDRPRGGTQHAPRPAPDATAGRTTGEGPTPSTSVNNAGPTHAG
jgi:hypothetical protein